MSQTPFRILVGADFSETASLALDYGLEQARRTEHSELHVLSVIDDSTHHLLPAADRHATLTQMADRVRELLSTDVQAAIVRHQVGYAAPLLVHPILHVRPGAVAEQIAALAMEIRADLVIVGAHGRRGIRRLLMGSVAERTIRLAPCPVLVVRPKDFSAMQGLPVIEPPCPACVKEREQSHGAHWWCAVHEAPREPANTYTPSERLDDPATPLNHML